MTRYFVSFNPEIGMEENIPLFAGLGDPAVRRLIANAAGIVLPGYVSPWRYHGITRYAKDWFPKLDARFTYPGKSSQILLFRKLGARHPDTLLFKNPSHMLSHFRLWGSPWGYPLVLKGDTGGGGSGVFPIHRVSDVEEQIRKLPHAEPVLLQRWVDHGGRDLRVVVYGNRTVSYFRIGDGSFYNNVCRGGRLDYESSPEQREKGSLAVLELCRKAGIDIAGFDLMFPDNGDPVFVEINFHFGRKGLGGTRGHREHVLRAVNDWRARRLRALQLSA